METRSRMDALSKGRQLVRLRRHTHQLLQHGALHISCSLWCYTLLELLPHYRVWWRAQVPEPVVRS